MPTFPSSTFNEVVGLDSMNVEYHFVNSILNVEFKPVFSPPLLIKSLFSTFLLSAIRVMSSSYLWMLILLPAILIAAWDLSRPAYWEMHHTHALITGVTMYTLSFSFPNFKSFSCSMSDSNCCFLTYILVKRKVRWYGTPISLIIFHILLWSTQWKASEQPVKQMKRFSSDSNVFSMIQCMLEILSLVPQNSLYRFWALPC